MFSGCPIIYPLGYGRRLTGCNICAGMGSNTGSLFISFIWASPYKTQKWLMTNVKLIFTSELERQLILNCWRITIQVQCSRAKGRDLYSSNHSFIHSHCAIFAHHTKTNFHLPTGSCWIIIVSVQYSRPQCRDFHLFNQ